VAVVIHGGLPRRWTRRGAFWHSNRGIVQGGYGPTSPRARLYAGGDINPGNSGKLSGANSRENRQGENVMGLTKISYKITDALQRAEIAAGRDGLKSRDVDVDLVSMISDTEHTKIQSDGAIWIETHQGRNWNTLDSEQSALLTPVTALDALKKEIADGIAADDTAIVAWLALPDDKKIESRSFDNWRVFNYNRPNGIGDGRVKNEIERLSKICTDHNAKVKKTLDEAQAKKIKNDAEIESRKLAQLSEAVARLGTATQKARWVAGVMARSEVIDLIRADVFAAIGADALPSGEYHLPAENDEYGANIEHSESDKKTLTDAQFGRVQKILALVPGATATYHHEYYKDHDDIDTLDIARLKKTVGEYAFSVDVIL
jgi:hypothetical protein